MVRAGGLAPASSSFRGGWPRANARLLLTLHPEIGCQTWTRTKTSGLTGRRATLTPPGNGAAGRSSTCIVPLRRRTPHVFGHGSKSEIGQRGRNCTCGPSVPGRACCCYTTRCSPRRAGSTPGTCFHGDAGPTHLEPESRGKIYKIGALDGTCTHTLPAVNGLLFYSGTRAKWWEVLVTLQFVASDFVL